MKTKLFLMTVILILSSPFIMSQGIGILGGVNFQNLNGKDYNGDKLEYDMTIGFHGGVNVQMPIAPDFYFQPGLLFSTKGAKDASGDETLSFNISYLELPLNVVYKPLLGKGHLLLGFGPYVGYGIMGKVKAGDNEVDIKFKNTVTESDPDNVYYMRALDAGGNIFVGYEMEQGLFFQLNTQLGMLKINSEYEGSTEDKSSVKNTGYGLSLGYRF